MSMALVTDCVFLLLAADPEEMKKAQEEMGSTDPSSLLAGMLGGGKTNAEDSDDD
jgi:hypothetical protein